MAVEALLPSLSAAARAGVLLNMATARAARGDAAGAERLLDRVETAAVDWPPTLVDAVLEVALAQARAGRAAAVKALGRRLLPLSASLTSDFHRPLVRVVAAFLLGNVEAGLTEAARADLTPAILYRSDRHGRHFLSAVGLLLAGLLGRDADAAKIRAAFERRVRAKDEEAYLKYASRWMDWAEVRIHLGRGAPARALPAFRRVHPRLQASLMPLYVTVCLEAGRPDLAESVVWVVDEEGCDLARQHAVEWDPYEAVALVQARVEALLRVAESVGQAGGAPAGGAPEVRRLLRAAARIIRRSTQTCFFDGELGQRLVGAQERAGDAEGAAETRRLLPPPSAARYLAGTLVRPPLDPERRVKERLKSAKPGEVPEVLLSVAGEVLTELRRLQTR